MVHHVRVTFREDHHQAPDRYPVCAENFIRAGESDDARRPMSDFVVLNDRKVATVSAVVAA
jgi:hypothetical protein